MERLKDQVAIVTGAGAGIGAAIAATVAREGAKVIVADIDAERAGQAAERIRRDGADAQSVRLDLGDSASIEAMIAFASKAYGRLDLLVNNAAATVLAAEKDGPLESLDIAVWDETMRINLTGTMLACKFAIPQLRAGGGGAIVNICSNSMFRGMARNTAYACSKAAIACLTRYIAVQHGREGIRCNAISPGFVPTKPAANDYAAAIRKTIEDAQPSARGGLPEDIAWMAVYLASREAGFVNGQVFCVDGGEQIAG